MNIADDTFEVAAYDHPFVGRPKLGKVHQGATISEIVAAQDIDPKHLASCCVVLSRGANSSVVPMDAWGKVRPKAGSHVLVTPRVHGPAVAFLASAALAPLAGYVAGTVFGLAATSLAYGLTVAAITVVGSLLISALIPPPNSPSREQDDPNFSITGQSNAENPYGVYPTVLGRHLMYPPKTARGFTSGQGETIFFHGRYTFGYGPVALESLRIGTTPITDFKDVEIEFLNVDQAYTLARMPQIAPMVRAWRTGTEVMHLYPNDISEDVYSVDLKQNVPEVRQTQNDTITADIDVTCPGLIFIDDQGRRSEAYVTLAYRYRLVGSGTWTDLGHRTYAGKTTSNLRFPLTINFPAAGRYEIEVTRISQPGSETTQDDVFYDDTFLTAIRSFQSGLLPSHANISEVAVRIRATEQLNGQLDTLNGVVQQLAPVWDGSAWTAPQPVRHPAWVYARALMGPMLENPVADTRLQLQDLKDWADQEPHWTVDGVIDQKATCAEVLDMICATGRARRTLRDLKYSIVRDGGAGSVVQQFSQRNSYDFEATITFPRKIHGFRVRFISEHLDWQQDELIVYADGYDANNATEFETLDLRGVVQPIWDFTGGNPWRLGRYHWAQSVLRPESYTWKCDADFLRVQMGDKVRLVHDVPLIGVGTGRIKAISLTAGNAIIALTLDEDISVAAGNYRMIIRKADGGEVIFDATAPVGVGGQWAAIGGPDGTGAAVGDLVLVEETTIESMEVLVKAVYPFGNLQATLTGVPAAPAVLLADQGTIPAYVPNISQIKPRESSAPAAPQVTADEVIFETDPVVQSFWVGSVVPQDQFATTMCLAVLSDAYTGDVVFRGDVSTQNIRIPLTIFSDYSLRIYSKRADGTLSQPVIVAVSYGTSIQTPADVENFSIRVLGDQAFLTWDQGASNVKNYRIKYSADPAGDWDTAVDVQNNITVNSAIAPALQGAYLIKAVSVFGFESQNAVVVTSNTLNLSHFNVVETVTAEPGFAGTLSAGIVRGADEIILLGATSMFAGNSMFSGRSMFSGGAVEPVGTYELSGFMDLTEVYTSRLSAAVSAYAFKTTDSMFSGASMFSGSSMWGDVGGSWRVQTEVSITDDDPASPSAVWSAWQPLIVGDYSARGLKFRVQLYSDNPQVGVVLDGLTITVDMPERIERGDDIVCPPAGVMIAFNPPFKAKPAILVDGQGLPTGARSVRTAVSRSGFTQQFLDSGGTPIAATFDFGAVGYGREVTSP